MLTDSEIIEALARTSYFPGWKLSFRRDPFEGPIVRVEATVPNAYDWNTTTDLGIDCFVPPMYTIEGFYGWLSYRLGRIASHESREAFQVDGKAWSDPHGETA